MLNRSHSTGKVPISCPNGHELPETKSIQNSSPAPPLRIMAMLEELPLDDDDIAIRSASASILERAVDIRLTQRYWSLAELHPKPDDYAWLLLWAESLTPETSRRWLDSSVAFLFHDGNALTKRACIGLLLLFLEAEVGRREATEGELWPAVRRL